MTNDNIGAVVENLIQIKDNCNLNAFEREAINYACNILDNCFNRLAPPRPFIQNNVLSMHFSVEHIVKTLINYGFIPSQQNVNLVLSVPKFKENFKQGIEETTTQLILKAIMDCGIQLEREDT